jgi:SPP1 gp7 family putative phage head morphogenesis protein
MKKEEPFRWIKTDSGYKSNKGDIVEKINSTMSRLTARNGRVLVYATKTSTLDKIEKNLTSLLSDKAFDVTRRHINLNRTIKGGAIDVKRQAVDLVKLVGVEFAKREGQRFLTMSTGVTDLLETGLGTLESLIRQNAIDIADANTPRRMTKTKIKELLREHVAPAGTLNEMTAASSNTIIKRVSNTMARMNAESYSSRDIRNAIIGTVQANYTDGVLGSLVNGSEVMSRTASLMATQAAEDADRRADRQVIGYIWVSVLDAGTTITCADLNGREFYYKDSGIQPLPPQHIGCRSTTEPISSDGEVPQVASIKDFFKENPEDAREMVGATRYKLITEGRLRVDRLTDSSFTPMNLDKLREKNAVAFKRAGVE